MQSDLGGEALFLYPRDQSGTALIPYVGVQRTNQEKRGCGTGAGFEAEVKIKLPMMGEPSRAVLDFGTRISHAFWHVDVCRFRVCLAIITTEMKGVISLRRCRE